MRGTNPTCMFEKALHLHLTPARNQTKDKLNSFNNLVLKAMTNVLNKMNQVLHKLIYNKSLQMEHQICNKFLQIMHHKSFAKRGT